ncbi:MAG: YybH family protein [Actinomycetes bacterium]
MTPHERDVVETLLTDLVIALRKRDPDAMLRLFAEDAVLFGSQVTERAEGHGQLREFFGRVCSAPFTLGWEWQELLSGGSEDVIWFVGPAELVVQHDDGSEQRLPYRLSGVAQRYGVDYLLALFNGAEPQAAD